jgi:hypothetical protein
VLIKRVPAVASKGVDQERWTFNRIKGYTSQSTMVRDLARRLEVKKVPDALDSLQLPVLELARVVVRRRHDAPVVCACRWSSGVGAHPRAS